MTNTTQLTIGEIAVRQCNGRFSLNDLHKAAGGEKRHQPGKFLFLDSTKALIAEIENSPNLESLEIPGIPAIKTREGRNGGTYACRELVIAYAAWISAAFHLKVIRVFLASQVEAPQTPVGQTLLGTTIGTDGFHCLAALLDGKVRHLPAPERKRAKMHVWSQVHKAFSVVSTEHIPCEQLDSARNFIAAYALEGEWLVKEEPKGVVLLNAHAAQHVYLLMSRIACMRKHRDALGNAAQALKSEPLLSVYSQIREANSSFGYLDTYIGKELYSAYRSLGSDGGYAARL